jgi:LuxR family maltose regulon positive regulatory protein
MSAPLCDTVLGITNSQQILRELNEVDLFVIPLDDEMYWFRYHHLFADFLKLCLDDEQGDQTIDLHNRAARWYEENGYVNDALNHYLSAENYAEVARLVEGHARDLLERSELSTLMKWVETLPEEYVCSRPWLCVYHAWALRLSGVGFQVVESRIIDADRTFEKQGWFTSGKKPYDESALPRAEANRLMGHIIALRAFQALYTERIPQVINLAEQAKLYNPEEAFVRSSIGFALGWAYRFSGDLEASYKEFDETTAISHQYGNIYMAVAAKCRSAYGKVMGGHLHRAMKGFQEAEQMGTGKAGRHFPVVGYAYVYEAGIYYEWNDLQSASQSAIEGIELCKQVGYILDQLVGYAYLARARLAMGEWDNAQDACQDANNLSQMMKGYVYALRWAEDCQVRTWVALRDLDALSRWVQECGLKIDDDLNFMRDIEHIILARALLAIAKAQPKSSHLDKAITLLARLRDMAQAAAWNGKLIEILALQASAYQVKGENQKAIASLAKALTLAEPEGYLRTFVDEGQPMAELLQLAASKGIAGGYTQKLIAAFEPCRVMEQSTPTQPLVDPLTERELEVLHLLVTDLSGPEIARELSVALSTVRYHSNNIYSKLAVHNRRAAVSKAQDLNIL